MNRSIRLRTFIFTTMLILLSNIIIIGFITKYYSLYFEEWQTRGALKEIKQYLSVNEFESTKMTSFNSLLYSRYGVQIVTKHYEDNPLLKGNNNVTISQEYEIGEQGSIRLLVEHSRIDLIIKSVESFILVIVPFILVLSVIFSYFFSGRLTRPIIEINEQAKRYARLELSERINIEDDSEIGQLAYNLNLMADQLSETIERLELQLAEKINEDKLKTEFIANISHELKTPLSIITCHTDIMTDETEHYDSKKIEIVQSEIKRMNKLVNSMLDLLRYEENNSQLSSIEFDLNDFIKDILLTFKPMSRSRRLNFKLTGHVKNFEGDIEKLEVVFINLISNAVKYSNSNSLITIELFEKETSVEVKIKNDCVYIENPNLLIRRFYQADKSRNTQGNGLGLSIVEAILRLHKSNLVIKNIDKGIEVSFLLPKSIGVVKTHN